MKFKQLLLFGVGLLVIISTPSCSHSQATDEENPKPKKFTPEYDEQLSARLHIPHIPTNNINQIKQGMSETKFYEFMKSNGRHQFTAIYSNQWVRCVEYVPNHYNYGYYFVFTNSILYSVCHPPKEEYVQIYDKKGTYVYTTYDRSNPKARIPDILSAPNLLFQENFKTLMHPDPPEKYEPSVDWGLTIAWLMVSPLKVIGNAREKNKQKKDETDYMELADKYASLPFQILPNMKRDEVEFILGDPKIVLTNAINEVVYYYGEKIENYTRYKEFFRVAITYEEDCLTGIYMRDFLDNETLKKYFD